MNQTKRKPLLNRKETRTLLNTLKAATTAGALSLTLAGWGLLAQLDAGNLAQAKARQSVAMVAPAQSATSVPTPASRQTVRLDVVQWVQDARGNAVAVVRDSRGALWYVMGSDIPRLEKGQPPLIQPQLVRITTRTRAS